MEKEYYLFVNGKKIPVTKKVYQIYWKEKNHENYLKQLDIENQLLLFSSFDHDGHFEENIEDKSVDVDKIVQTQMMIDAVQSALEKLTPEEREIIEKIYFEGDSIRKVARTKIYLIQHF